MINVATFFYVFSDFFSSINGKFFSINGIYFSFFAQNSKRNGSVLEMAIFEEMQWQMNENLNFCPVEEGIIKRSRENPPWFDQLNIL